MIKSFDTKIENLVFWFVCLLGFSLALSEAGKQIFSTLIFLFGFYLVFRNHLVLQKDIIFKSFLIMLFFLLIGTFLSIEIKNSIKGFIDVFRLFVIFLIVRAINWNQKRIFIFLMFLVIGYLITLIWGFYRHFELGKMYVELKSVGHVNHSAIYMLIVLLISSTYLFFNLKRMNLYKIIFFSIVILLTLFGIFISDSRAVIYTILILSLFVFFLILKQYNIYIIVVLLLSILVLIFSDLLTWDQITKLAIDPPRINILNGFYPVFLENLYFGIGLDNSSLIQLKEYYADSYFIQISHAHNTWMTYLVERGFFVTFAYLVFIVGLFIKFLKIYKENKMDYLILSSLLIWLSNFIISVYNTTFHHENALLMLMIWAITLNYYENRKDLQSK